MMMTQLEVTPEITTPRDKADYRYLLDHYILDPSTMTLIDSTSHQIISQDEKLIKALILMADRYPDMVTKDELMEAIWPNLVVTEWSITRFIADARKVLGERHHIKTVHGRGYRYSYTVKKLALNEPDKPSFNGVEKRGVEKKKSWLSLRNLLIVAATCCVGALLLGWNLLRPAPNTAILAVVPVSAGSEHPAWHWGVPALLAEQLNEHAITTVNMHQLRYAIELWQKDNPNKPLSQMDVGALCSSLGCSQLLLVHQEAVLRTHQLRYELLSSKKQISSQTFIGENLHHSMALLWRDLKHDLSLPDMSDELRLDSNYATEAYVEALGNLVEDDLPSAKINLQYAEKSQPDFIAAKIHRLSIFLSRNELDKAEAEFKTVDLSSQSGKNRAHLLLLLSQFYFQRQVYQSALNHAAEAKTLLKDSSYQYLQALSLLSVGVAKLAMKQSAADDFYAAETLFKKHNHTYALAKTQVCIAENYQLIKQNEQANEMRKKANQLLDQLQLNGDRGCNLNFAVVI